MRYIKNFLYNLTDIVLAVIIVTLAAGIIYWRMNIILAYPDKLASEQAVYQQEETAEEAAESGEEAAEGSQTEQAVDNASEEPAG